MSSLVVTHGHPITMSRPRLKGRKCSKLLGFKNQSIKREQAISALLTTSSICDAAAFLHVAESTIRRWLRNPTFLARYRKARRQCVEGAIARIQQLSSDAVECLQRNMACGIPSVEIRAAAAILDHAMKGTELLDLQERLEKLEAIEKEQITMRLN